MSSVELRIPGDGEKIVIRNGKLQVPENPIIPFIEMEGAREVTCSEFGSIVVSHM